MVDTARSPAFLLGTLQPSQPEPPFQTTWLAQSARDAITTFSQLGVAADSYQFSVSPFVITGGAVNPSRVLNAGVSATVRFPTPGGDLVPQGVNGSDVGHYVYISGGTGTAEAVLITGGTAVSGGTGTLTFTPANNHSGAWVMSSGSGGISEAFTAAPTAPVLLKAAAYEIYAPITVPTTCPGIFGLGSLQSILRVNYLAGNVIVLAASNFQDVALSGFSIQPFAGTMTSGSAISSANSVFTLRIHDLFVGSPGRHVFAGIILTSTNNSRIYISDTIVYCVHQGIDLQSYFSLQNVQVLSDRTLATYQAGGFALNIHRGVGGIISGFFHDSGIFESGIIIQTAANAGNEILISNLYLDNWAKFGLQVAGAGGSSHVMLSNFRIHDDHGVFAVDDAASVSLMLTGAVNWQVSNGNISFAKGTGVILVGCTDMLFTGVNIYPAADATALPGAAVVIANSGNPDRVAFTGCQIGEGNETASLAAYGIRNDDANTDSLSISGGSIAAAAYSTKIFLLGTETNVTIAPGIGGIGNQSVAAAAALAFPLLADNDVLTVTGNTAVTSVLGLRSGQRGTIVCTGAAPGQWTLGNNIGSPNFTPTQNKPFNYAFIGTLLYVG